MAVAQGCSTIIKGSKQSVIISSNPSEANVYVNGIHLGKTPAMARLMRKNTQLIKIELEGYSPYLTILESRFNGWIFGNIIFGGLVGIIVDAATGSMYSLKPEQVQARFELAQGSLLEKRGEGIYVGVTLKPDPSWTKIGQLERE